MLVRTANTSCPRPPSSPLSIPTAKRTRGQQLLVDMESFVRRMPHLSLRAIGERAAHSPALADRLRDGAEPTEATCRKVRSWMQEYVS